MNVLGIIPAAGEGSRWGGATKELLPIGQGRWLIDNTLDAMTLAGVTKFIVITSPNKVATHVQHFQKEKYGSMNISFVIQKGKRDIWSAIMTALPYAETYNIFAMPDTIFDIKCFRDVELEDFSMGTFKTSMPDRFGVIVGEKIINKQPLPEGLYTAWGSFIFSKNVAVDWIHEDQHQCGFSNYTDALNYAIYEYGLHTYPMNYYYDLASWKDYTEWIANQRP